MPAQRFNKVLRGLSRLARKGVEKPLYTVGIELYRGAVSIASLRSSKARKLNIGQHEIRNKLSSGINAGDNYVWIHAASLGEFEQGRPLIEKIKRENKDYKILLTFFSPSGYEVRKNFPLADCVCYLPFDTPNRVKHFLDMVNPRMAIFIKYEFWRNYLEELHRRKIPTYLISAVFRPNQMFFKKRGSWYGEWLKWYTRIFVQDERSRELLSSIGIDHVDVCGDTRFDRVSDIRSSRKPIPELERFTRKGETDAPVVMMAGSSWPADENVYAGWFNRHPDVKLVIAPHEFDEERLAGLKRKFVNGCVLLSDVKKEPALLDGAQVLVIDCFGLLSSAYYYCDVAYIGGGFGAGLHNINEAAVYDVPVIYGPNNSKFIEAREMAECGGGIPVRGREDFEREADRLLGDRRLCKNIGAKAGAYIRAKLGATDRVYSRIFRKS